MSQILTDDVLKNITEFESSRFLPTDSSNNNAVTIGDFNGDGNLDIAAIGSSYNYSYG